MPVEVSKRNFVGGPDGALVFQEVAPYSASSWLTISPSSFQIPAGKSQVVTVKVALPAQPEPGDHQVALVFLVPARKGGANIKINRGISTPVYVTVPGPTDDSVAVSELHASGFALGFGGPMDLTARVRNTGTVHRDFRGDTELAVGGAGTAANFADFSVLRGATRRISTSWDPPLMCICHPSVSVANADGIVHTTTVRVIVFPLLQVGIALGALLLLGLGGRLIRRGYRRHVIRAAAVLNRPVSSGHA
jgi:hypothetical protein